MAIGDVFYRVMNFTDDAENQFLAKIVVTDPSGGHLSCDNTGSLTFKPHPEPPKVEPKNLGDKYRLETAGDMFRPVLLRNIPNYSAGEHGGLIVDPYNLSQKGDCWIDYDAKVTNSGARVMEHAKVLGGSVLSGRVQVSQRAQISDSTIEVGPTGNVHLSGDTVLRNTTLRCRSQLNMYGLTEFNNSTIDVAGDAWEIGGCCVEEADIRTRYELLSFWTPWRWMSAFRNEDGELTISIGCQSRGTFDAVRTLAEDQNMGAPEMAMLEGFFAMVRAAQETWQDRG